jgi:hypothetical protein
MLKLPPIDYSATITAYSSILELEFGLMPDSDLVAEIFGLQTQNPQVKVLPAIEVDDGDLKSADDRQRLKYSIQYPRAYEPINLARALAKGLSEHGYTVRIVKPEALEDEEEEIVV